MRQAVVSKAVRAKVPVQIEVSDGLELVAGPIEHHKCQLARSQSNLQLKRATRTHLMIFATAFGYYATDDGVHTSLGEIFGEMEHLEGRSGGSAGPMGSAQQVAAGAPKLLAIVLTSRD